MRITGWSIDGFGFFSGYDVRDLSPALTIVHGPNEAGKSTLLNFVRGVLFGFPDARSSGRRYPALRGGQYGGRLFLENAEGNWTVQRSGSPPRLAVIGPDDAPATEGDLVALLGHADRDLFRSIFAFSLDELTSFEALEGHGVRERIFASSLIGGGKAPSEVIRLLDQRGARLLRERATGAQINALKAELRGLNSDIRAARREAEGYPKALKEREKAAREVERATEAWAALGAEVEKCKTLLALWPDWSQREQELQESLQIQVPDGATEEALGRLKDAVSGVKEARVRLATLEEESEGHQGRLAGAVVDDRLLQVSSDVKKLFRGVSAYEAAVKRLDALRQKEKEEDRKLARELEQLGAGWDRDRIVSFDMSIPAAEQVREWEGKLEQVGARISALTERLANADKALGQITGETAQLLQEMGEYGAPPDRQELDTTQESLGKTRALLAERAEVTGGVENAQRAVQQSRVLAATAATPGATGRQRTPGLVLGIGLVAVGVLLAVLQQWVGAAVLVVAGLAVAVLWSRMGVGPGARPAVQDKSLSGLLVGAEQDLANRQARLKEIEERIAAIAQQLGLPAAPSSADVEARESLLQKQREARMLADRVSKQLGAARDRQAGAEKQRDSVEAALAAERGHLEQVTLEWDVWRAERGVPEPLSPDGLTSVFTSVGRARESFERLRAATEDLHEVENEVATFEATVGEVLRDAGRESAGAGASVVVAVQALNEEVSADEETRRNRAGLETAIAGTQKQIDAVTDNIKKLETTRDEILREAGAASEDVLRELVGRRRHLEQLLQSVASLAQKIETRLGRGPDADNLRAELNTGDRESWQRRIREAEPRLKQLHDQRDEAVRAHRDAEQLQKRIEQSSDVVGLETQAGGIREEMAEAAEEWQVIALARALIDGTLARFQQKNQPKVVSRASSLFKDVTAGHYERVLALDKELAVLDKRDVKTDAGELSTGAAQQLYLCLRFALAESFAEKGTALPLVMDEVLVNFDPERGLGVGRAIVEVAEQNQVLLFTCHPETVEMVTGLLSGAPVIALERWAGTAPISVAVGEAPPAGRPAPATAEPSEWDSSVVAYLESADHSCGKAEIVSALGMREDEWRKAISSLVTRGAVEQHGSRRGATYALPGG